MSCLDFIAFVRDTGRCRLLTRGSLALFGLSLAMLATDRAGAHQDAESLLSEDHFFEDIPVVFSATRLPQSVSDAPVSVTVIDRDLIEASGFTEVPDLLRLAPGFIVNYESGYMPTVGYHMLHDRFSRRMQVLIDGRSVYTPAVGGVPWTDIPLTIDNIERIEVIRGPNAVTYGSNSFMAVVNIITRHAAVDQGARLKAHIGSNALAETFAHYNGRHGDLDYRVTAAYRQDDGFDDRFDARRARILSLRSDYRVDNDDAVMLQLGFNKGTQGQDDTFDTLVPNHSQTTYSQFQQLRWTRSLAGDQELYIQFYHNQNREVNRYLSNPVPALGNMQFPFDEGTTAERYDIEFQHRLRPSDSTQLVWGLSTRKDKVTSPLFFNTDDALDNRINRLFVNAEQRLGDRTVLNAGIMLEDNDISQRNTSPRIAINHHMTMRHTLRASVSRAHRIPVMFEDDPDNRFPAPIPNNLLIFDAGELDAETITAYELGYIGHYPAYHTSVDFKLYYNRIRDLITFNRGPNPQALGGFGGFFGNFDNVKIRGLELSATYQPDTHNRLLFNYTHQEIDGTDNTPFGLYSIAGPKDMLKIFGMHDFGHGFDGSLGFYYLSRMREFNTTGTRPQQSRFDMRLAHKSKGRGYDRLLALTVQNLFDSRQGTVLKNNIDRRLFITLGVNLK